MMTLTHYDIEFVLKNVAVDAGWYHLEFACLEFNCNLNTGSLRNVIEHVMRQSMCVEHVMM